MSLPIDLECLGCNSCASSRTSRVFLEGSFFSIAPIDAGDGAPSHISPIDLASVPNEQLAHLTVHPTSPSSEETALTSVDLPIPGSPLIIVDLPSLTESEISFISEARP